MKYILVLFLITAAISANAQRLQIGDTAPEIALPDPGGDTIRLSEVNKGRYVLVDFWANWCAPCRVENSRLVAMYSQYSTYSYKDAPNGFTIYSISLDKNRESWMHGLKRDTMPWTAQVSELKGWNSKAAYTYKVMAIPQAFLINPEGKIIAILKRPHEVVGILDGLTDN